ncbi:hypothetical protein KSP39_PZI014134 [Platanthera zijinensis]|uniref:Retrovirus-related Pol polyprotein from transposon TNT 1-94-like beta-barrel domain-containing protein n=1 Tax=Platanthera zijinensis TaxID=2320716 RepID=A0AAP0BCK6_9ASPA
MMKGNNFSSPVSMIKLEKFTATEFTDWKLNTQFGMKYLNVFYTVQSDRATVMETEAEAQWIADEDFCSDYLLNCLSSSLAKTYIKLKTAKEIWEALEEHFRQEDDLSKTHLVDKFHSFMFDEEKAILPQASTEWFLDSGATCHVFNNADLMTGLTTVKEYVTVANGVTADVLKVGNATLLLSSGTGEDGGEKVDFDLDDDDLLSE